MSKGFIYLIRFGGRVPSFLILSSFPSLPSVGDVVQLRLPEGMQSVNFDGCFGITGTAELEMVDSYLFNTF